MPDFPPAAVPASRTLFERDHAVCGSRTVPQETAIAFTYDRTAYAVMMGSPADLEDFATGFSLTEAIVEGADEIAEMEIVGLPNGIELRMSLAHVRNAALSARRRRFAGPAGCGLCGIESLDAATVASRRVQSSLRIKSGAIFDAVNAIRDRQHLNLQTHAVHAAGFWSAERNDFTAVREDVGRHNALDKLVGALARSENSAGNGFIVMTSRISIELVQKAATTGCPILVAISAPTALAIREAEAAGMTIVAIARGDSFEVFAHPERIVP